MKFLYLLFWPTAQSNGCDTTKWFQPNQMVITKPNGSMLSVSCESQLNWQQLSVWRHSFVSCSNLNLFCSNFPLIFLLQMEPKLREVFLKEVKTIARKISLFLTYQLICICNRIHCRLKFFLYKIIIGTQGTNCRNIYHLCTGTCYLIDHYKKSYVTYSIQYLKERKAR